MDSHITVLFLGDVVGQSGCRAIFTSLSRLVKEHRAELVVANVENAAEGFGVTPDIIDKLSESGVDVFTTGNHIWQRKEILASLDNNPNLLRPENYPKNVPGSGVALREVRGMNIAVVNLQGLEGLYSIDSPFEVGSAVLKKIKEKSHIIIVDFHAESTAEKEALGLYFDGKVSAVVGTHTHIQTADERVLPGGTAYITDTGMTGPINSVIGSEPEEAIRRSLTQMPLKIPVSDETSTIQGVVIKIDVETGRSESILRVKEESAL